MTTAICDRRVATAPALVGLQTPDPQASVIIVNYNGHKHLGRCLAALRAHCPAAEVILVDNASTDGSVELAEQAFPCVRVVRNGANGGFGHGNNVGARWARGEYLVFLNPDTVIEPGWLEALTATLEANPQGALVTSKILLAAEPERINTCGNEVHCSGLTLCRGAGQASDTFSHPEEVSAVSGAAFALPRSVFEHLGGFDEQFFLYMEDTDLSLRARLAGYRCIYTPHSVVRHDYRLRFGPRKTFYQERNRYLMLLKCLRWRTLLILSPALLLAELVTWGFVLLHDRQNAGNKLLAYLWVLRHWKQVMAQRRRVQATRRTPDRALIESFGHRLAYEQTGTGYTARLAHVMFDPLFTLARRLALTLVHW